MKVKNRYLVYLTYVLLLTLVSTVTSWSRYKTTVTSVGTAQVARPVTAYVPISAELNGVPLDNISGGITIIDAAPGDSLVYVFEIRNYEGVGEHYVRNQVRMRYRVVPRLAPEDPRLPLTMELEPAETYPSAGADWTLLGFDGEIIHRYTLTVTWPEDVGEPDMESQEQKIVIEVCSEQTIS